MPKREFETIIKIIKYRDNTTAQLYKLPAKTTANNRAHNVKIGA